MPAARKKACEPTHIETASAAVLNAICRAGIRRRNENTSALAAITSVAGPGPNSNAVAMTKASSSIAMVAVSDAKFNRNDPATIATTASASHWIGCGTRTASSAESTSTNAPDSTTACR